MASFHQKTDNLKGILMSNLKTLSAAILLLTASGCAFNPQQANLNPELNVASSNIGNTRSVYVNVLDERSNKSLGRRGTAYGAAAEITSEQELSIIVDRELKKALKIKGFKIAEKASADNLLTVEIRGLEYSTSQGFWTGGVHITGALKGRAKNGSSEMEKMYRYEKEERVVIVPTAETNEKWLNEALTETLNQLINDPELLNFLSKTS